MASDKSREVFDFLASFPMGMNSGVDPLLLPKGQLAFAQNCTNRGDFLRQRPPFQTITLSYIDVPTQNNFQAGLFQGALRYKPDTGSESIMVAVAGHLFQITPDATASATVADISIPGDSNPATSTQMWFFQAENYLVGNDGVSAPLIYDGTTTFRSNNGQQAVLGVVAAPGFIVPAVGSSVTITLSAAFTGTLGQAVSIADATYLTVAPASTYQASLTNYTDTVGNVYPIATPIILNPNVLFYTGDTSALPANFYYNTSGHGLAPRSGQIHIPIISSYTGAFGSAGSQLVWNGILFQVIGWVDSAGTTHDTSYLRIVPLAFDTPPFVAITNLQTIPNGWLTPVPALGDPFYQNGSNLPVQTVGTLSAAFTAPAQGIAATASLTAAYTGPANQPVQINGSLYLIAAITPGAGSPSLTVINENDTPTLLVTHSGADVLSIPQLPTGRMGTYGMGRIWLSLPDGLSFLAGDIVGGASGTLQNNFRDAVLNIAENTFLAGGGTFRVPGSVGDIRAMRFVSLLDVSLGQGPLQVFTTQNVFGCQAPVDRTTWTSLTNPILVETLKGSGGISQDAITLASGDLIFRASDGTVRSLLLARLDFNRWGNTPVSREMQRVLDLEDKSLLAFDSSAEFDNRYLLAALPTQSLRGVYHPSILALNFDPLSSLREKQQSVWDGEWTGLNVLKLISGFFNNVERCFALCLSTDLSQIELHEILPTTATGYDDGATPIPAFFESPVLDFDDRKAGAHTYKRLKYGEIFVDSLVGPVSFQAYYKPDQWPNWVPWYLWTQTYTPATDPGFRPRVGLPMPDGTVFDTVNNRPLREGFNFQFKLVITGPCRFLGARFSADLIPQPEFAVPVFP